MIFEHVNHKSTILQTLALDSLSILMIQDRTIFDDNVQNLIEKIRENLYIALNQGIVKACLKALIDGVISHNFLLMENEDILGADL